MNGSGSYCCFEMDNVLRFLQKRVNSIIFLDRVLGRPSTGGKLVVLPKSSGCGLVPGSESAAYVV